MIKVEELREATGYRVPVSVKLGAGRIRDDIKIALKDGFDFVELDGMQGSTGAAAAEVLEYVGIPTISAIVEALDALAEIGRAGELQIVLMGGIRDGVDAVKGLCLGADAVAMGSATIVAGGCIACMQCPRRPMRPPASRPKTPSTNTATTRKSNRATSTASWKAFAGRWRPSPTPLGTIASASFHATTSWR